MTKKPIRRYTVDGKRMTPDDLQRLHDYLLDIETIAIISDEMRIVIESEGRSSSTSCHRDDDPKRHIFREAVASSRRTKPSISSDVRAEAAGSIAVISATSSSTKGRYRIPHTVCREPYRRACVFGLRAGWQGRLCNSEFRVFPPAIRHLPSAIAHRFLG